MLFEKNKKRLGLNYLIRVWHHENWPWYLNCNLVLLWSSRERTLWSKRQKFYRFDSFAYYVWTSDLGTTTTTMSVSWPDTPSSLRLSVWPDWTTFESFWQQILLQKKPKRFGYFLGFYWKHPFKLKLLFGPILENVGLHFSPTSGHTDCDHRPECVVCSTENDDASQPAIIHNLETKNALTTISDDTVMRRLDWPHYYHLLHVLFNFAFVGKK